MQSVSSRRRPLLALAILLVLVLAIASRGGDAPERPTASQPQPIVQAKTEPMPGMYRASDCKSCHDQDRNAGYPPSLRNRMICRMNEWPVYEQNDKHAIAYRSLESRRSQEMVEQLGRQDSAYRDRKPTEAEGCLSCHSVRLPGDGRRLDTEALAEGVSCVACHGPYPDWVEIHPRNILLARRVGGPDKADPNDWTEMDRTTKERRYGMTDLWDPVRRAEVCASCHIGNVAEKKVVTHTMYAAGHPPLPSFEVSTFGEAQPRHWESLREKVRLPMRWQRLKPPPDPQNLENTRLVVLGGLVSLRESMKLIRDQARASGPAPDGTGWPDFARFDCYACHHELPSAGGGSWRQVRRRDGRPGRPTPPDWPWVLARLGTETAGPNPAAARPDELHALQTSFSRCFQTQPFGNTQQSARAADAIVKYADTMIQSLNQTIIDATKARRMLDQLCQMARDTVPDFESARQIAWAFRVIYREIVPESHRDATIESTLASLNVDLSLDLPPPKQQAPIASALRDRLRLAADFDPRAFQERFRTIAAELARLPAVPARPR
jgi:hypothetical protein